MKGLVDKVNNNGIKIGDNWYNAIKECEKYVTKDLEGCEVELTMLPNSNKFAFVKVTREKVVTETVKGENKGAVSEIDIKYRSMAISFSKDLVIADKISEADMITIADGIFFYIKTGKRLSGEKQ